MCRFLDVFFSVQWKQMCRQLAAAAKHRALAVWFYRGYVTACHRTNKRWSVDMTKKINKKRVVIGRKCESIYLSET